MPPAVERILILKPSSLGDLVHALPVLAALRRAYPRAWIAWLVASGFADLLTGHPMIDELILFDRERFGRLWRSPRVFREFVGFIRRVRGMRFDLVIDLQGLLRSALIAYASGARRRIGFADARELAPAFYTRRVRCPTGAEHAVERNLCVAADLGAPADSATFPLPVSANETARAAATLGGAAGGRRIVALVIGARWATKRWPVAHMSELLTELLGLPQARVILIGSPGERVLADEILAGCDRARVEPSGMLDLVGASTLRDLTALLSLSAVVVCQDSGPMHIAAALGRPVVALFGPTNPRRTGPYGRGARVVSVALECAPCYARSCRFLPRDPRHHRCMRGIAPEQVVREVRAVLSSLDAEKTASSRASESRTTT